MKWLANAPLSKLEKGLVLAFLFVLFPMLGAMVEMRSALMNRRMGDLDCFLRAAWAVRNDADIYAVTSDNDWHYNYPPFYAILMTPLADPPRGEDATGYLPYHWSVLICFLLSTLTLFWSADALARALEEKAFRDEPVHCRRWWFMRLWPVVICFLPIGHSMMRGQVNVFVLALLCAALAGWIRGHNFRAGWWLALAICIKVIPAYLVAYPLWKRDGRALGGCAVGCLIGLVLLPLAAFGPARTVTHYETYAKVFLGPILKLSDDDSRKDEIVGVNATDSVGVKNAIQNWMYPDAQTRPQDLHLVGKGAYLLLGFTLTFLTLWPRADSASGIAHQFGCLVVLMTIFSPVSHSHYLMFCVPVVMSLLVHYWQDQPSVRIPWPLTACFIAFNVTMLAAYLPGLEILKDRCAALFVTLPFWAIPVMQLWRGPAAVPVAQEAGLAA